MRKQGQTEYVILLQATKKSLAEDRLKSQFFVQYLDDAFSLLIYPVVQCVNAIQCFLQHLSFSPVFQRNLKITIITTELSWVFLCRGQEN